MERGRARFSRRSWISFPGRRGGSGCLVSLTVAAGTGSVTFRSGESVDWDFPVDALDVVTMGAVREDRLVSAGPPQAPRTGRSKPSAASGSRTSPGGRSVSSPAGSSSGPFWPGLCAGRGPLPDGRAVRRGRRRHGTGDCRSPAGDEAAGKTVLVIHHDLQNRPRILRPRDPPQHAGRTARPGGGGLHAREPPEDLWRPAHAPGRSLRGDAPPGAIAVSRAIFWRSCG